MRPIVKGNHFFTPVLGAMASATTTQDGCLHDIPSVVIATQRFFCLASATQMFHPGASTPGNSGNRPFKLLPLNLGPRVKVRYLESGDQVTWYVSIGSLLSTTS